MARVLIMDTMKKAYNDAGGIRNFPSDVSMVEACCTEKPTICACIVQKINVVAQIGNNFINILTSSTFVTVQSLHGFGEPESLLVNIAALSKQLSWNYQTLALQCYQNLIFNYTTNSIIFFHN
jgi:hypothetical protein